MLQYIIIAVLVLAAAAYLIYRVSRGRRGGCSCGSGGDSSASCDGSCSGCPFAGRSGCCKR
ncbi:MAG: hypothetical protein IKO77_01050 [Bacteroidales bacterium]|nr:hypothetical protein [Bacteroidales bacterium]